MEAKKFISTLKSYRTRFTNKQDLDKEKKYVSALIDKQGGKLEVISLLNEQGQLELKEYVKKVLGVAKIEATEKPAIRRIEIGRASCRERVLRLV